ncbi:hypothetical protein [Aphanothece sacrum]|uniref:Gas vesicle protein n=1 Tax=Aphanothece sacrum FPU1 TaxID=1920663 RepID=A0A401IFV7_APHSA|nr:hypothetical protein [Aphanothece sacrum]GBF80175.1 hypothetical protein AsFPU1_1576 [Aphanothece sacrum FPU1]GBF85328.1 hypothetical protein AsFPU3_2387 [Aphanothece sacrum FPU3]
MSQRDGFTGGFLLGTLVGGVVGGVMAAVVASRQKNEENEENTPFLKSSKTGELETEASIEMARRRLEDKIAQLNNAIDDVRQQLGPVNGKSTEQDMPLQ